MRLQDDHWPEQVQWSFSHCDGLSEALYHRLETFCARAATDGHVPAVQVPLLCTPGSLDHDRLQGSLEQLLQAYPPALRPLLERTTVGFYLPYFLKSEGLGGMHETSSEGRDRRAKATARKNRWRGKTPSLSTGDKTGDRRVTSTLGPDASVPSPIPVPTSTQYPVPEMHISVPLNPDPRPRRGGTRQLPQTVGDARGQEVLELGLLGPADIAKVLPPIPGGVADRVPRLKELAQ